jgi:small-conductance mechanosensitive channel
VRRLHTTSGLSRLNEDQIAERGARTARRTRRRSFLLLFVALPCLAIVAGSAHAQTPARNTLAGTISAEPSEQHATVVFFNRPIVVLRARVLGRLPAERADSATRALDERVSLRSIEPVEWRPFEGGAMITVGSRPVLALTPPDIDELSGDTLDSAAARVVDVLRPALAEATGARSARVMLRSALEAATIVIVGCLMVWGIARAHRAIGARLVAVAEQTATRSGLFDVVSLRASRLLDFERWLVTSVAVVLQLVVVYTAIGMALRRVPYTRPWGESMRGFLVATAQNLALGIVSAVPGLLTAALILMIARFLIRLIRLWFDAVEQGRLRPRWIYPETAQPTRRLLTTLVWLFAIVVAYPYMPGSQTDAFKGVSVFLGLMVTLGSSGLMNQIMSGFVVTYSRAVRVGDYVRIGDVEGTVLQLGVLSAKLRTPWGEEVTVPNAVVVGQTTTDYSRFGDADGVFTPTSVTIGYDAPWRQVQALLLMAAERTPGLRREPKPVVIQTGLEDFYVKYTLLVCLERQESRVFTLHELHAQIQDVFNEHGVQIMSPNYVLDPAAPKVVAKKDWFAAPARPDSPLGGPATTVSIR